MSDRVGTKDTVRVIKLPAGEVLFRQGDDERVLYKVLSGEIGIYSCHGSENELLLSTLGKDCCFGEMAVLEQTTRSATAVALEDSAVMAYPETQMVAFITQNPFFAVEIMRNLCGRLRHSTEELEKTHRLVLELSENKAKKSEVQAFISRYTEYDAEGRPRFVMRV